MKTCAIQVVIKVDKQFEEDNEPKRVIGEIENDIRAYLESMTHATDMPWSNCTSIGVTAKLRR